MMTTEDIKTPNVLAPVVHKVHQENQALKVTEGPEANLVHRVLLPYLEIALEPILDRGDLQVQLVNPDLKVAEVKYLFKYF